MSLSFNAAEARKADKTSMIIRETGAYKGVITRAEKLLSKNKSLGVGFSFKSDDGQTASYLDVYTENAAGEVLWGANLVQAVLGCLRLKDVAEGEIQFERWDNEVREMVKATAVGYPALMNKRIGFVLQRELGTYNGADTDKVVLARVFEASSGLTSSEIQDGKTKGELLAKFLKTLPEVVDKRKKGAPVKTLAQQAADNGDPGFDDIDNLRF